MWSHQNNKWVFNGVTYDDPNKAEHLYVIALLDYVDHLEHRIKVMEGDFSDIT